MQNDNGLSLIKDEKIMVLALDGKRLPGQCALWWEDNTSPAPNSPAMMTVTVVFEVPGEIPTKFKGTLP